MRDGTLGSGKLEVVGPGVDPLGHAATYLITPELGEQSGSNLFHSFARFGIGVGETATFTGPDPIEGPQSVSNVISRVTGGNESQINGTLRSTIPGADVWLLNPSGVVFGEGAQLDVPGSFHASTGDSLGFGEGGLERFYSNPSRPSVLSTARPEAFGFLSESGAKPISVTGATLETVRVGDGLELVGGDVTLTRATLDAPGGAISIRGERILVQDAIVRASAAGEEAGGTISVSASESVAVNRGFLEVDAFGAGDAGTLTIGAESLIVAGGGISASSFGSVAGHIGIDARSVEVSDSFVFAAAFGDGAGGTIDIDADDLIVRGISPAKGIDVGTHGSGKGGTITIGDIATPLRSLTLSDGGYVSAIGFGSGDAGSIAIAADSLLVHGVSPAVGSNIDVGTQGGGNAGSITIDADSVSLEAGGQIVAHSVAIPIGSDIGKRAGKAGTILVHASESISVSNEGGEVFSLSRALLGGILLPRLAMISIGAATVFGGQGGSITLEAPEITVSHGALVGSSTVGGGDAGSVRLRGENIHIVDGGNVNSVSLLLFGRFLGGKGGNVELLAGESIEVAGFDPAPEATDNRSAVTASKLGSGPAGSVTLRAPRIVVEDGGIVQTTALQGFPARDAEGHPISGSGDGNARGGDITLDASDGVIVRSGGLVDASSFVQDRDGEGSAGEVVVAAGRAIRIEGEGSRIESRTGGMGTGGNVSLTAPRIEIADDGIVSARSVPGYQGVGFAILAKDGLIPRAPATATGNAGAVNLDATEIRLINGGTIATNAEAADGGSVRIEAKELVHLDAGVITAAVSDGAGGNITIDPEVVILQNGSRIVADAGAGSGGNIQITADNYFAFPGSVVDASSDLGIDGLVEVHTPDVNLAGQITALPTTFLDAASLMRERCAARRSGERAGSFAVRGNGGIPAEPDGWLPGTVTLEVAPGSAATSGRARWDASVAGLLSPSSPLRAREGCR